MRITRYSDGDVKLHILPEKKEVISCCLVGGTVVVRYCSGQDIRETSFEFPGLFSFIFESTPESAKRAMANEIRRRLRLQHA